MAKYYYEALSTDDEYIDLLMLQADGDANEVNRQYLDGGVIESVFEVEAKAARKANPAIKIGTGFFSNALRDYDEWRIKWWRECVQNAVDARAKEVYLSATQNEDDGTWTISCEDDGKGMNEDILFNKFLVLGESGKEHREGQIGGFGKAKELLILPWIEWEIRTGTLRVFGSGVGYEVERGLPRIRGTKLTVLMPDDNHTSPESAMEFLQRCSISGVHFYINNERFADKLHKGKEIGEFSFGPYFHNKSKNHERVYIRAQGMYMFSVGYLEYGMGTVIIELEGDTTKILTANRDGFVNYRYRMEIDNFLNQLATEKKRALMSKSTRETKIWEGVDGKLTTEQGMTDVLDSLGPTPEIQPGEALSIPAETREEVAERIEDMARYLTRTEGVGLGPATAEIAVEVMRQPIKGQSNVQALAQQLVWTPPFMVHNELEGFRIPRKFTPEGMTPKVEAVAKLWAECCRWVFIQLGVEAEYGVGFVFSDSALAMFYTHGADGSKWLLLNPYVDIEERGGVWSKTKRDHLKNVYISAIHEVTHMADGYSAHDASFISLLERNTAKCLDGFTTLLRIAKAIKIRTAEPRKPRKQKAPEPEGTLVTVENLTGGNLEITALESIAPLGEYLEPAPVTLFVRAAGLLEDKLADQRRGLLRKLTEGAPAETRLHPVYVAAIFGPAQNPPILFKDIHVEVVHDPDLGNYLIHLDNSWDEDIYHAMVGQVTDQRHSLNFFSYVSILEDIAEMLSAEPSFRSLFEGARAKRGMAFHSTLNGDDFSYLVDILSDR